ncbi:MAG: hypothetical protein ACE5Q6_20080 [Dehalococcoidia bacterium]
MKLRIKKLWTLTLLALGGTLLIMGCTVHSDAGSKSVKPIKVEEVSGSKYARLSLTDRAVTRLGLEVVPVNDMTVPYEALIYGLHGETYVYTSPEPLLFTRQSIKIKHVEGDTVYLKEALPPGTLVVTYGAAELYGAEKGVGK